ncbi:uncharacterized protein [Typha angustifolia]|uniref:uncharacterized protein n=1 Tax=Typha angustifolia TaxID=59011 RepID=UPI003C2F539B
MGSLMAGWDSPVMDENKVRARRNKSLTKEEIEAFRKLHRKTEGEEEEEQGSPTLASPKQSPRLSRLLRVHSAPPSPQIHDEEDLSNSNKPDKTGDWWTRSNWAFLNEPPLDEAQDSARKYTAQFHVAQLATEKRVGLIN